MVTIENIKSVLTQLSIQLGLPELRFDDDQSCFLAFDDQVVNIQYIEDKLYLTTHVLTLAEVISSTVYEALLQANLYRIVTSGATIALEPESRAILLQDVIEGSACTLSTLTTRLEALLATKQSLAAQIEAF